MRGVGECWVEENEFEGVVNQWKITNERIDEVDELIEIDE